MADELSRWWRCGIDVIGLHAPARAGGAAVAADRELRAAQAARAAAARFGPAEARVVRSFEYAAPSIGAALGELARYAPRAVVVETAPSRWGRGRALARAVRGLTTAVALAAPGRASGSPVTRLVIDASPLPDDPAPEPVLPDGGLCSPGVHGPPGVVLLGRGARGAGRTAEHLHKVRPGVSEVLAVDLADLDLGPDDLVVRRGQPFGAHGGLQLTRADRRIVSRAGSSLLLTRPVALVERIRQLNTPGRSARSTR
ncbi:hypothetical protein LQ327_28575 [Actinomycetospora endophytica]|uniref:ESX secretion-associated protein EspG n=1 Tax=Actinomycetospora endophytica TaxID=2291215 RepID=A0ABS8PGF1_9PSEU|nr:hypothetical protein [Actinomycetospora endophytica]MCD2197335.1 hypothetical protein [Actinomycetospora endophytica]